MERLTQQQLRVLLEFVRGFYACHDRDASVSYLLYGISMLIPAEVATFAEIDGEERIIDAMMQPSGVGLPDFWQIYEQHLPQHPHLTCYQQTGDVTATKLSDLLTRRQFHTLKLYTELYRPMRVEHMMSIVLPEARPNVIGVTLHRSRRDFSERDRFFPPVPISHPLIPVLMPPRPLPSGDRRS
jgi:hypothetical protein